MLDKTRAAHPKHFAPIKAEKDADHTRALVGFLPWAIVENQGIVAVAGANESTLVEVERTWARVGEVMNFLARFLGIL